MVLWVLCVVLCLTMGFSLGLSPAMKSRQSRTLIFPPPVPLILGTGIPVALENQSVTVGYVLKSAYLLPVNATVLATPYVTFQKRSGGTRASRYDFYRSFENAGQSFGGGGKACMLRTICEAAKTPLKASGLAGQLLHIFLTPSTTDEIASQRTDMEYHSAELLGKEPLSSCQALYPDCAVTIMDILTVIL